MSNVYRSFEAGELKKRPFMIKAADRLTAFFGSVWFLVFNLLLFSFWISANTGKIPGVSPFDPYPYFFLTTGVSLEAIILTITVLVSQQRQNQVATMREEIDMQINKIAEKEITKALEILKKIAEKQGVNLEKDQELSEMLKEIEIGYIERKFEEQLAGDKQNAIKKAVKGVEREIYRP